jgi:cation transport ATPase
MEFEEMQKIWNEQKGETMYAINETALHQSITRKKYAASKRINKTEISLIIINSLVSIILLVDAIVDKEGFWDYVGAFIMMLTVVFLVVFRLKRKKEANKYDRSMLGELDHAIANTRSILQIATTMIYWYLLPVGFYSLGKMIYFGASLEKWLLIIGLYTLAFFLVQWERKKMHIPRKESLLSLKKKLMEE